MRLAIALVLGGALALSGCDSDGGSEETGGSGGVQVSIENRGTEPIYRSTASIGIGGDQYPVFIQVLQPDERRVITIPSGQQEGELNVSSEVSLSDGSNDAKPTNDQRDEVIILPADGS